MQFEPRLRNGSHQYILVPCFMYRLFLSDVPSSVPLVDAVVVAAALIAFCTTTLGTAVSVDEVIVSEDEDSGIKGPPGLKLNGVGDAVAIAETVELRTVTGIGTLGVGETPLPDQERVEAGIVVVAVTVVVLVEWMVNVDVCLYRFSYDSDA